MLQVLPSATIRNGARQAGTAAGRFWGSARGFWFGADRLTAWSLTTGLVALILIQLWVQYRLNVWNRDFFDAVAAKSEAQLIDQALIFLPLAAAMVVLSVVAVYGRMTMQRRWRAWMVEHLIGRWLDKGHYYQLNLLRGEPLVPEGRITDDARNATDAPVDFAVGVVSSAVTAITFVGVLWTVGGAIAIGEVTIPGYLVISAVIYSAVFSLFMILFTRNFVRVTQRTEQTEAEFRYALTRVRENGESIALLGGEAEEQRELRSGLWRVIDNWRRNCFQHMRSTVVSTSNWMLAPTVPLLLCMPKYVAGTMSLGEVTQIAAAFVLVQSSFNWLVDNYDRFAYWMASARRVGDLIGTLDRFEAAGGPGEAEAIKRTEEPDLAFRLRDLTVESDDGTVIINDADATIGLHERVLLEGESGTGKTTLVRAIAGLWPWGRGEIGIKTGARMFLMPQRPYIPLGNLRRVLTYPTAPQDVSDDQIRALLADVGLGCLSDSLDEAHAWDHALSGGEKQRVAFARLLLHRPELIIMDEATSALDVASQTRLMNLVIERLPASTIVSIAHRPELEAFHNRKLVFEHRADGSHLMEGPPKFVRAPAAPEKSRWRQWLWGT